jgi:hypothetical protein
MDLFFQQEAICTEIEQGIWCLWPESARWLERDPSSQSVSLRHQRVDAFAGCTVGAGGDLVWYAVCGGGD